MDKDKFKELADLHDRIDFLRSHYETIPDPITAAIDWGETFLRFSWSAPGYGRSTGVEIIPELFLAKDDGTGSTIRDVILRYRNAVLDEITRLETLFANS